MTSAPTGSMYYQLTDDGRVEPCERYCSDNFRIGEDTIGESKISTVFLSLDHNYLRRGDAVVFETMVFGGVNDGWQDRYTTLDDAKAGHAKAVEAVRAGLKLE